MTLPKTIACSLVDCRLDCANYVLLGMSVRNIQRLQRIQSTLARVVTRQSGRISVSETLKDLHWPPVKWRINIKVATLTYKVLESGEPSYMFSRIAIALPRRKLRRSSDTRQLAVLPSRTKIGARGLPLLCTTDMEQHPI